MKRMSTPFSGSLPETVHNEPAIQKIQLATV